jgi:hypothetical protein
MADYSDGLVDIIVEIVEALSPDAVNPSHYAEGWSNGAQVIDITENLNFNRGNCIKYAARAGRKSKDTELEDLKKSRWYLDREIQRLEGQ